MTHSPTQQMAELMIQKSLSGLNLQEQQQLDHLISEHNVSDDELKHEMERIELAVAAADLACFQNDTETIPNHLKDCVLVEAGKFFESQTSSTDTNQVTDERILSPRSKSTDSGINGWMVMAIVSTAACILLFLNSINSLAVTTPSTRVAMEKFLASSPTDLMDVPLLPGPDIAGVKITDSRLVWSDARQEGYMQFKGLSENDPKKNQYQLWIFKDAAQKYPVDGGVFDVTDENAIVAIDPKILAKGKFFAVTVEPPGGVVVSDRKRIASVGENLAAALAATDNSDD